MIANDIAVRSSRREMSHKPSDTSLLRQHREGDSSLPAHQLWERYFTRLAGLAKQKMRSARRRVEDEEDVALSALDSFFRGLDRGAFERVERGSDIWQVLAMLAERKYVDRLRRETAQKRGGGKVRGDSVFEQGMTADGGLEHPRDKQPGPEFILAFAEECQRLFDLLENDELRIVAQHKSEGFTVGEIAEKLNCSTRSVERKLKSIRDIWASAIEQDRRKES